MKVRMTDVNGYEMRNKSMDRLRKQRWNAFLKALVDEKISREESIIVNGNIIYFDDMVKIRDEQKLRV